MPIIGALPAASPTAIERGLEALKYSSEFASRSLVRPPIALGLCEGAALATFAESILLLDGRIDNHKELLLSLDMQHLAPAEILLHAYHRWGDDFANRLVGDFSFALWDGRRSHLLLGRDVAGRRPLFYWHRGDEFHFASEPRALLASTGIPMRVEEEKLAEWLVTVRERSNRTFFKSIFVVPSGHTLVFERGRVTLCDFWQPEKLPLLRFSGPRRRAEQEYAEGLRAVLNQAIRDRLSEYQDCAGSHLSGGLDSSSVSALAAAQLASGGRALTSFTAVSVVPINMSILPGTYNDEGPYAAAVASMYPNIRHVLIPNNASLLFPVMDTMAAALSHPVFNPGNSIWMQAILHEAKARGLRMIMTGEMGNMTISWKGDYAVSGLICQGRWIAALGLASQIQRHGRSFSSIFKQSLAQLLPPSLFKLALRVRGKSPRVSGYYTGLRTGFAEQFGISRQEKFLKFRITDGRQARILGVRRGDHGMHVSSIRRVCGIEYNDPTSDKRVMEFCFSVPEEFYCMGGDTRSLIRAAMAGLLPDLVLNERRGGLQSADFIYHLAAEKNEIAAELERMRQSDLISRAMDLPSLQQLVDDWPADPSGIENSPDYGIRLSRAVSFGRFVRRIEDGTLFNPAPR